MNGGGPQMGGAENTSLYIGFRRPPSPGRQGRNHLEDVLMDAISATTGFRLRRATAFVDRPYAFVEFWNPRDALEARRMLHGSMLLEQEVTVRPAEPARNMSGGGPRNSRGRSRSRSRSPARRRRSPSAHAAAGPASRSRSRSRSGSRSPQPHRRHSSRRSRSGSAPRYNDQIQQQQQQQQPVQQMQMQPQPQPQMQQQQQQYAPRPEAEPLSPPEPQNDVWRGLLFKGPAEVCNVVISATNGANLRALLPDNAVKIETRSALADLQQFVMKRAPAASVQILCDDVDESRRAKYAELRTWLSAKNVTGNIKLSDGKVFYVVAAGSDVPHLPPGNGDCFICGLIA
eukprot:m51a1_g140 hypothetical protein (344) ;mRNA; f:451827-453048